MKRLTYLFVAFNILQGCSFQTEPVLELGLVADPQYAGKPASGTREYSESCRKLEEAIAEFNERNVDFVQNLGDIIDGDWASFDSILPVYRNLRHGIENYHLLGNHDFAIDSSYMDELLDLLSMPYFYYSYEKSGWRFIVLDATDYSYFSNALHGYNPDLINTYYDATEGKPNHYPWNSAIGKTQQEWLKAELDSAGLLGQKVIIFSHMPLRPQDNRENLWNDIEILDIIESSPDVVAFINGHKHSGNYAIENGIHYLTIHGMVESGINSFGILEIYKDHMVLKGFGNQPSYKMKFMRQENL